MFSTFVSSQLELQSFADRAEQVRTLVEPGFRSVFRVCNLRPSLDLLDELKKTLSPPVVMPPKRPRCTAGMLPFLLSQINDALKLTSAVTRTDRLRTPPSKPRANVAGRIEFCS